MDVYEQARRSMATIYTLIAVNVLFYIYFNVMNESAVYAGENALFEAMILYRRGVFDGEIWRLLSYAFLHSGFMHLLFNMWGLYLFGQFIAPVMKPHKVVLLYVISAVVGGLFQILFSGGAAVGASGAVCGFTVAGAMIAPNVKIVNLFFPIPFKIKTFFWVFLIAEIVLNMNQSDNIAHMAHLGGVLGGYLYTILSTPVAWDPFGKLTRTLRSIKPEPRDDPYARTKHPERPAAPTRDPNEPVTRRELDALLDKISRYGINSLTDDEYSRLRRARDSYKKR